MKTLSIAMLTMCLWLIAPWDLGAQPSDRPSPVRLTLEEAISRGLATSHRLAEASARAEAADAVAVQRHAAVLPQLAAQAGYTRTNHVDVFGIALPNSQIRIIYPDIPDNFRTRVDAQWPIYTAGRLDALERAARADAGASAEDLAAARADLRLEIARAYWALATAGEALRVVDESVTRVAAHLKDVRNQLEVGLVPPSDVSIVEALESRQRMLAIQARATREVAEADLARLTGIEPGVSIALVAAFEPPAGTGDTFGALVGAARQQRRERAALAKRIAAVEERQVAAAAGTRPVVAVAGGFDYARPNPRIFPRAEAWKTSWDVSVNVNWPLFDGGRSRAEMTEASANRRAAEERLAEFDVSLAAEVRQRTSELTSSRAAIDAAADGVRAASEARRVVDDRFRAGVATTTDVLDAQVALLQAELDRTQAIASARLAEARLARALGRESLVGSR